MWQSSAVLVLATLAGCRSNPNYCEGPNCGVVDGDVDDVVPDVPGDDAQRYRPIAVRFEANDYLTTDGFEGNPIPSPRGTFSVWLRFTAGDATEQLITMAEKFTFFTDGVRRTAANQFQFKMPTCTNSALLNMATQNPYTTTNGWVHVLAAWDVSAGFAEIWVNGVRDVVVTTLNNGDICYTADKWGIGGLSSGRLDADVSDLYVATGTLIDITLEANRRKFRDAAGKPVDLGADCSAPTGAKPSICLRGDIAGWNQNKGSGGGMTVVGGGLSAGQSNPAD